LQCRPAGGLLAHPVRRKASAKRCVQLSVQLIDGSVHTALFQFK